MLETIRKRKVQTKKTMPAIVTFCLLVIASHAVSSEDHISATCTMNPLGFEGINVSGVITLWQKGNGNTTLNISLYGFPDNNMTKHGFHVHENGDIGGNCSNAGAHYNPLNKTHGGPGDQERHVGDLGNIAVDQNHEVHTTITDNVISLTGNYSVLNRALVVHSGEDDLGKGMANDSKTTGHSGYRIGCCVIMKDSSPVTTILPVPTTKPISSAVVHSATCRFLLLCHLFIFVLVRQA